VRELPDHFFTGHKIVSNCGRFSQFSVFLSFQKLYLKNQIPKMPKKGVEKNTQNKAKHTKLLTRKKEKLRKQKEVHKARIKAIVEKAKEQKKEGYL
jgi:hypothetical protein